MAGTRQAVTTADDGPTAPVGDEVASAEAAPAQHHRVPTDGGRTDGAPGHNSRGESGRKRDLVEYESRSHVCLTIEPYAKRLHLTVHRSLRRPALRTNALYRLPGQLLH